MMAIRKLITEGWQHATTIIFVVGFLSDSFFLPAVDEPITKYLGLNVPYYFAVVFPLREWVVSRNTASKAEQRLFSLAYFWRIVLLRIRTFLCLCLCNA
jgi:hypothetical protein